MAQYKSYPEDVPKYRNDILKATGVVMSSLVVASIIAPILKNKLNNRPKPETEVNTAPLPQIVVIQEKDYYPIPKSLKENERFSEIEDQHLKTASNLVSIVCDNNKSGTGVLINPYQVVTANHVMDNCKNPKLSHSLEIDEFVFIPQADFAVINLNRFYPAAYSLTFAEDEIKPGRKAALVALDYSVNPPGIFYETGEVVEVNLIKGVRTLRTNIPCIHGTSGGIYVDKITSEVIGFHTDYYVSVGSINSYNGPTVDIVKVVKRERKLKQEEEDIKWHREDLERLVEKKYKKNQLKTEDQKTSTKKYTPKIPGKKSRKK